MKNLPTSFQPRDKRKLYRALEAIEKGRHAKLEILDPKYKKYNLQVPSPMRVNHPHVEFGLYNDSPVVVYCDSPMMTVEAHGDGELEVLAENGYIKVIASNRARITVYSTRADVIASGDASTVVQICNIAGNTLLSGMADFAVYRGTGACTDGDPQPLRLLVDSTQEIPDGFRPAFARTLHNRRNKHGSSTPYLAQDPPLDNAYFDPDDPNDGFDRPILPIQATPSTQGKHPIPTTRRSKSHK